MNLTIVDNVFFTITKTQSQVDESSRHYIIR